jgi:hydrogenase nickel incorporation protein HypA/HybF
MHEWALAEAVISTSIKTSVHENLKKISEIIIKVGELQQIDMMIFQFALKEIIRFQDSGIDEHTKFTFITETALLQCRVCHHKWPFKQATKQLKEDESESIHFLPEAAHVYIRCPRCDSPDFEITSGRGVWVDSIKGER